MSAANGPDDAREALARLLDRLHEAEDALGDLLPPENGGPTGGDEGRRVWRVEIEDPMAGVHLVGEEDDARLLADAVPGNVWVEPVPVLDHATVVAMIDGRSW